MDTRFDDGEGRWIGVGMSHGRVLVVAYTERNEGQSIRIVSARRALSHEREACEKRSSGTDWNRVDSMSDAEIDTSEIGPLDDEFFANAERRLPKRKESVTLRLDGDVLEWFRANGCSYQTRINAVLKLYVESRKRKAG